jgi:hypothetical protein
MARPVGTSPPALSVQARRAAQQLERLADRWMDGRPPSPEELRSVADDLGALLTRITVIRAVVEAAAARPGPAARPQG